jgi:hypothetical protein
MAWVQKKLSEQEEMTIIVQNIPLAVMASIIRGVNKLGK